MNETEISIAPYIDHTMLKAEASSEQIEKICSEAIVYQFCAVCVAPYFVPQVFRKLEGSKVKVATVVGFPMGYTYTTAKAEETRKAIQDGADEIDMVVNLSAVHSGDWNYIKNEIDTITQICHMKGKQIKVIFEVELLNENQIIQLCNICTECKVDFVKTSTGILGKGNQPKVVQFLRSHLPEEIKIKASGGISNKKQALALIKSGANRLGASKSLDII